MLSILLIALYKPLLEPHTQMHLIHDQNRHINTHTNIRSTVLSDKYQLSDDVRSYFLHTHAHIHAKVTKASILAGQARQLAYCKFKQ